MKFVLRRPVLVFPVLLFVVLSFAALLSAGQAGAQTTPHPVKAALVSNVQSVAPGTTFTVALRLQMEPGWHTYWKNPGDTGLPTTIAWTLPEGVMAGALQWPAPQAQRIGPFINYGFEHEVLLPTEFKIADITATSVEIKARADWLMCKEVCIPDGADLTLTLPVTASAQPDPANNPAIKATLNALPKPLAGWQASARGNGDATITVRFTLNMEVAPIASSDPGRLYFFSEDIGTIEPSFAQSVRRDGDDIVLTLPVSHQWKNPSENDPPPRLRGVLRSEKEWSSRDKGTALTLDVPIEGAVSPGPIPKFDAPPTAQPPGMTSAGVGTDAASTISPGGSNGFSLGMAALFALLGGVILNLMPCVFPIISLKVLGFVQHGDNRATLRHEALAFGAGVVLTFVALGGVLLALRAMGTQLGWGFQLQSPAVITGLALLFFVMALNLSGVFEFGALAPSGLAGWTSRNRTLDAFGSGVLAVVVASPCTAPFMGAALGYALTQNALTTAVVFAMLGLGMALPYALLAFFPAWQRFLPKPGAWMLRLKQLLAFPLYATAAWLAWVLGAQMGSDIELRLLLALVMVALALWAWHGYRMARGAKSGWIFATTVGIVLTSWLVSPVFLAASERGEQAAAPMQANDAWQPYSAAAVARENAAGKTVFVDFTAAWCVTCQANKKWVLDTDDVQQAFARHGIVLMRADWTRRDPAITEALAALGRNGVPVYAFYQPGQPPHLLPELLQKGLVLDALPLLSPALNAKR